MRVRASASKWTAMMRRELLGPNRFVGARGGWHKCKFVAGVRHLAIGEPQASEFIDLSPDQI
jgi:hypothetical protein